MRARKPDLLFLLAVLTLLAGLSGCSKEVKADFPRPPATAAMSPGVADREPEEGPTPAESASVETPAESSETEPLPEPESASPSPPRRARRSEPPEEKPDLDPEHEPVPPSTQLARSDDGVDPDLLSKLQRASSLLSSVGARPLSSPQQEQLTAARGFVVQARKALSDGDERRALVLIDKGLILVEDVERITRP